MNNALRQYKPTESDIELTHEELEEPLEVKPFTHMEIFKDHPFKKFNNTVYMLTEDCNPDTEILKVLTERRLINLEDIKKENPKIGTVIVTSARKCKFLGLVIKAHIDCPLLQIILNKCIKNLVKETMKHKIKEICIARDKELMKASEVGKYIEKLNEAFKGKRINVKFYHNSISVPPVEERLELIKLYHESPGAAGHREMIKSLYKLMQDLYWKGMQEEVYHVIRNRVK